MRRTTLPLVLAAALFTVAGGYIHLREWLDTYRYIPAGIEGAVVVRVGFPLNAALSLAVAVALVVTVLTLPRLYPVVVGAAIALQVGSLAALILSREGNLLGWAEPVWTGAAKQTLAVEIGALVLLGGVAGLGRAVSRRRLRPHFATAPAA